MVIDIFDKKINDKNAIIWQYVFEENLSSASSILAENIFATVLTNLQNVFENSHRAKYLNESNCNVLPLNRNFQLTIKSFTSLNSVDGITTEVFESFLKNCSEDDLTNYKMTSLSFIILSLIKISNNNVIPAQTYEERLKNIFENYLKVGLGIYKINEDEDKFVLFKKSLNDFLLLTFYYVILKKDIPTFSEIAEEVKRQNLQTHNDAGNDSNGGGDNDSNGGSDNDNENIPYPTKILSFKGKLPHTIKFNVALGNNLNSSMLGVHMFTFEELKKTAPALLREFMDGQESLKKSTKFDDYFKSK